jgi:hypothetical protein
MYLLSESRKNGLRQLGPSLVAAAFILAAFGSAALAASRTDAGNGVRVGRPVTGAMGVTRTTADIMREQASRAGEPAEEIELENEHTFQKPNPRLNPASPRLASIPAMPIDQLIYRPNSHGRPQIMSPQAIGLNFTGATLSGTNSTSSFPPDNDGAIGPTQYVIAVNGRLVSYNKTTGVADGVLNATTDVFFSNVRNGSSTSDPQIRYDRLTGRWFVTIINVPTNQNRWLLEVSDPTSNGVISGATTWTGFFFQPSTVAPVPLNSATMFSDYPTLSVDANALYVGVDEFAGSGQPFQQCDAFVIKKTSVLGAGPISVTAFRALMSSPAVGGDYSGPFAPRGVDNNDPTSNEGYMIGSDGNSFGNFWLVRIANPGTSPTLTQQMIPVLAENVARGVSHSGNATGYFGYLDNLDDRYFQATIRNQQLWTTHNIDVDNTGVSQGTYLGDARCAARWYQFNVPVNAGTPTIVQSGTVFTPSVANDSLQKQYFIPSLTISGQGHVAMGFSTGGQNNFVNAEVVGRLANDPLGTMQGPSAATANAFAYNPPSNPGGGNPPRYRRWGDYSQTTLDPIDDMTMWTVQQFVDATNSYGCRIVQLKAPPPATPSTLPDILVGQSSVSVTLTGTSSSGSGFYDPGPNLASPARPFSHLTATITVGAASGTPPTVTSATYVNPTTVNLVLNSSAATANVGSQMYRITITNPDGQLLAADIVHVVNPTITASAGAGGSISPSGAVVVPSGGNQTFTITPNSCFSIADVLVDGSSVGAVSSYTFSNVTTNHTIAASFVAGVTASVSPLSASQVRFGNDVDGTTKITLTFTPPSGAGLSVEVWRKGYGSYPTYDDGGGSVPPTPGSYPPSGWTLTGVTASGQTDEPATRDFWYYVAYVKNTCGDAGPVSNLTTGTLDYHLGDVSDGITPGQGDNKVATMDASLLGAHYGASGASLVGFEYLDVGPTTDGSVNGRPTTDNKVRFDDLVMFALNYTPGASVAANARPNAEASGRVYTVNALSLDAPSSVHAGDVFDVAVKLQGAGNLQALSITLDWNRQAIEPVEVRPGELVTSQGGVVFSPGAGQADAAVLGANAPGMSGDGVVATVKFRALLAGPLHLSFAQAIGRDRLNHDVSISSDASVAVQSIVHSTELFPVIPNPAKQSALVRCDLARHGMADLSIYTVDGRHVKTLVHGVQEAGRYEFSWDGTDRNGNLVKSGAYFVRLELAGSRKTRLFSIIR